MSISTKKPLGPALTQMARGQIDDMAQLLGRALPCRVIAVDGTMVTVNFEVNATTGQTLPPVTCAILTSRYVREPIAVGDKGLAISSSSRLGGVSGDGTGAADIADVPGNLGALSFLPIGDKTWETIDSRAVVIEANNGAIIRTKDGQGEVIVSQNYISITHNGAAITISNGIVNIEGILFINGAPYMSHLHLGVRTGTGISGVVVP